jgi:hypothetical protein
VITKVDYLYSVKKANEIEIGDIVFIDVDENNLPLSKFLVLNKDSDLEMTVFYIDEKELKDIVIDNQRLIVYYLGNVSVALSNKELMKSVKKRYVWMGIENDLIKVLINLVTGKVEQYSYEEEDWLEVPEEQIEDDNYIMILTFGTIRFKINLNTLKVQIATSHTLRFRNYNNYLLGLEGQYVFNEDNELNLSNLEDNS